MNKTTNRNELLTTTNLLHSAQTKKPLALENSCPVAPAEITKHLLPRLIRMRDAPHYLGMDKHYFNRDVRPHITVIQIGKQGIAFDRLDLDAWVEYRKSDSERPSTDRSKTRWDVNEPLASLNEAKFGISPKRCVDKEFAKALARAISKKPKKS